MSVFPLRPAALRWRQAKGWGELNEKRGRISGLRVRWPRPDAFLHKAPADPLRRDVPAAGVSADGQIEELTVWRQAALVEVQGRGVLIELEDGSRMRLSSLDSFEILLGEEEG